MTPGSDDAIRAGCTCPRIDNRYGAGITLGALARPQFLIAADCPLHGSKEAA